MVEFTELVIQAARAISPRVLSDTAFAGSVGCALLSEDGIIYTGVNIDTACSMGFCAEHGAASAMITAGSSQIMQIVAVRDGKILPPCGRCREFISQLNNANLDTAVLVAEDIVVSLSELLPYDWRTDESIR